MGRPIPRLEADPYVTEIIAGMDVDVDGTRPILRVDEDVDAVGADADADGVVLTTGVN